MQVEHAALLSGGFPSPLAICRFPNSFAMPSRIGSPFTDTRPPQHAYENNTDHTWPSCSSHHYEDASSASFEPISTTLSPYTPEPSRWNHDVFGIGIGASEAFDGISLSPTGSPLVDAPVIGDWEWANSSYNIPTSIHRIWQTWTPPSSNDPSRNQWIPRTNTQTAEPEYDELLCMAHTDLTSACIGSCIIQTTKFLLDGTVSGS